MPKCRMPAELPPATPATLSLDLSDESATTALYRAAIGPVGADHYLPVFARFELADRAGSGWNWAACLYTLGWMVFRRMWAPALAYVGTVAGATLAAALVLGLVFQGPAQIRLGIGVALLLLACVVPGVWGDAWLYAHTRKRMARALADSSSWTEAVALLDKQAVTRPQVWWLAAAQVLLLAAGLAVAALVLGIAPLAPAQPTVPATPSVAVPPTAAEAVAVAASSPTAALPTAASSATSALAAASSAPATSASDPVATAAAPPAVAPSAAVWVPAAVASTSVPLPAPAAAPSAAATVQLPPPSPMRLQASATPQTPTTVPPSRAEGPYFVNVGLFAVDANARRAQASLRAAGVQSQMQELPMKNGKRTRVRAGPYETRAQAEAAARQIRALGLEAQLFQPESGARR